MKQLSLHHEQNGLVSIVVTLVFVSIITLITVSFAFLMRRESQQVLDRQLSTQAFYAAESGVSDAIAALDAGTLSGNITDCQDDPFGNDQLNPLGNIGYSCVLVDQTPASLELASVKTDESKVVQIRSENGANIHALQISWQAEQGKPGRLFATNNNHDLPTQTFNNNFATDALSPDLCADNAAAGSFANKTGLLRTDIIPITGSLSRNNLINNTQSLFLYPRCSNVVNNEGTVNYLSAPDDQTNQGLIVDGNCNTANIPTLPKYCNVRVNGLGGLNTSRLYLRLSSIYQNSSVTIRALDNNNQELSLTDAQAVIDATGRANDVLRRIQVRVPLSDSPMVPKYALETLDTICKRLRALPGDTIIEAPVPNEDLAICGVGLN